MFVINTSPTVTVPVNVEVLNAKGDLVQSAFNVDVKRLSHAEWDALFKSKQTVETFGQSLIDDAALFKQVITSWGDVNTAADGKAVPFSDEALTALITGPDGAMVSQALYEAVAYVRFGKAALKN